MAGSITIQFGVQALDFSPLIRGRVTVRYKAEPGVSTLDLYEDLVVGPATVRQFQEVAWISGSLGENEQQAANFATAFNRDYRAVGLVPGNVPQKYNLIATASGDTVTITALRGTFESGSSYSGNVLSPVSFGTPVNTPDSVTPIMSVVSLGTGSCSVVNYNVSADIGTAPYRLVINGVEQIASWDGVATSVALVRGQQSKIFVEDSLGQFSDPWYVNVPRKLLSTDFEAQLQQVGAQVDLTVVTLTPVTNTTPLEYSLDTTDQVTGQGYQSSNLFPGVTDGTYLLFVKDKFGCEVSKNVVVVSESVGEGSGEAIRKFAISPMNSLSFARQDGERPNLVNTLSYQEQVSLPKQGFSHFISSDRIQTQFKSAYPFHVITLHKCDGSKEELNFFRIQQNLGVEEKVDCQIFPLEDEPDAIGVYFNGGNTYTPNTLIPEGSSPYSSNLPGWAEIGNSVRFDSLGVQTITSIGYDPTRNAMYFVVPGIISGEDTDQVQAQYNRHDYNVFRFDFPMTKVSNLAKVRIEAGFDFNSIDQVWDSETIKLLTDTKDHFRMDWEGYKILGDMLFIDGIKGVMWLRGRVRPYPIGTSDTFDGENKTYPLEQTARTGYRVQVPLMTVAQWIKFNAVSGISIGGSLRVDGMEFIRINPVEATQIGDTNYSEVTCEFAFSSNELSVKPGEVVYNISTGVEGSGGTGKEPVVGWDGFVRLLLEDGTYLRIEGETFIALG